MRKNQPKTFGPSQSSIFGFVCGLKDSVLLKLVCSNYKNHVRLKEKDEKQTNASQAINSLHIVRPVSQHMICFISNSKASITSSSQSSVLGRGLRLRLLHRRTMTGQTHRTHQVIVIRRVFFC